MAKGQAGRWLESNYNELRFGSGRKGAGRGLKCGRKTAGKCNNRGVASNVLNSGCKFPGNKLDRNVWNETSKYLKIGCAASRRRLKGGMKS